MENRKRDDRLRYAETRTLANAFFAEVSLLQDGLAHSIRELSQDPNRLVQIAWNSASAPQIIYQSNAVNIGKMGPEAAALIVEYYGSMWAIDTASGKPHINPVSYANLLRMCRDAHEVGKKLMLSLQKLKEP